jgi:hypothetical protein
VWGGVGGDGYGEGWGEKGMGRGGGKGLEAAAAGHTVMQRNELANHQGNTTSPHAWPEE